jgi:hypothetical protein
MPAKVSGTPMNADVTPMNAEKAIFVNDTADSSASATTPPVGTAHPGRKSSAFIGVPRTFARVTR